MRQRPSCKWDNKSNNTWLKIIVPRYLAGCKAGKGNLDELIFANRNEKQSVLVTNSPV